MSTINASMLAKDLFPGLNGHFEARLGQHPVEYTALFDGVSSDKRYEDYVQRRKFQLASVKSEGGPISYDVADNGFDNQLTNVTYGLGFKLTMEAIQDNQYIALGEEFSGYLADAMMRTKETNAALIYDRAFNSSYVGGDGKELCATDHPSAVGSQSNELAVAADLSETSIEDLVIQMMNATDDKGNEIALKPRRLIIPTNEYFNAHRILDSELQSGTANNDINVLRSKGVIPEVSVNHYLSDTDAWFIRSDIGGKEGLIHQERMPVEFSRDNEFETKNLCFAAIERYVFGWNSWRALWGSPGS